MSSTILVMDDDLLALESMADYLKRAGYTVVTASTAREAVEQAQATPCDAALLDMKVPEMDGFQVAAMFAPVAARPAGDHVHRLRLAGNRGARRAVGSSTSTCPSRTGTTCCCRPSSVSWQSRSLGCLNSARSIWRRLLPSTPTRANGNWQRWRWSKRPALPSSPTSGESACALYSQAFENMRRARGLSVEAQRLRELAECAQRIADEGATDSP